MSKVVLRREKSMSYTVMIPMVASLLRYGWSLGNCIVVRSGKILNVRKMRLPPTPTVAISNEGAHTYQNIVQYSSSIQHLPNLVSASRQAQIYDGFHPAVTRP